MLMNSPVSLTARNAPYGNEFTSPSDVYIKSSRLIHFDTDDDGHKGEIPSAIFDCKYTMDSNGTRHQNGHGVLSDLFSMSISNEMKHEATVDLVKALKFVTPEKLALIQNEICAYDPYQKGLVDASTLQRTFNKYYKMIPVSNQTIQLLFVNFALDPKRPRLIKYMEMMQTFSSLNSVPHEHFDEDDSTDVLISPSPQKNGKQDSTGHLQSLQNGVKHGLATPEAKNHNATVTEPAGSPIISKLMQQLNSLDVTHSGNVLTSHAQKIIQKYNDLHQLGLSSKTIQKILTCSCVNESDNKVYLSTLNNFLEECCNH